MSDIDFNMIRTVRVSHKKFESIKSNAKYLVIEDEDTGSAVVFIPKDGRDDNDNTVRHISDKFKVSIQWRLNTDGDFALRDNSNGYDYGRNIDYEEYCDRVHFKDFNEARCFLEEMLCGFSCISTKYYLIKEFYDIVEPLIRVVNERQKGRWVKEMSGNYNGTFIEVTIW